MLLLQHESYREPGRIQRAVALSLNPQCQLVRAVWLTAPRQHWARLFFCFPAGPDSFHFVASSGYIDGFLFLRFP